MNTTSLAISNNPMTTVIIRRLTLAEDTGAISTMSRYNCIPSLGQLRHVNREFLEAHALVKHPRIECDNAIQMKVVGIEKLTQVPSTSQQLTPRPHRFPKP